MEYNERHIELIEKYFDGSLNTAERADFDLLLADSSEFRGQVQEAAQTIATLKESFDKNLKAELKGLYTTVQQEERARKKRYFNYAAAAAVVLGLALVGLHQQTAKLNVELFNEYYKVYPIGSTTRGQQFESGDLKRYYDNKDFKSALKILESQRPMQSEDMTLLIYLGNCYLQLGQYDRAIETFKECVESKDAVIRETGRWYLALSYLANDEIASSLSILKKITKNDELYAREAAALIEEGELSDRK
jgi:tetratricopeptide (TPR) repeat protein